MSLNDELKKALGEPNLPQAEELLKAGADINTLNDYGESLLCDIIHPIDDQRERLTVTRFMLAHGANPRLLSPEGSGPLFTAVIAQDTELLKLLLDYGADPNREHDLGEPLYDYAEFDYRYETYDLNPPEPPTDADKASADTWL